MVATANKQESFNALDQGERRSYCIESRQITVWTPPSYGANRGRRCSVLYLLDGQNMLAPVTEPLGWGLGGVLTRLVTEKRIAETLAVGIWNTPMRIQEYSPQKAFDRYLEPTQLEAVVKTGFYPCSDAFLDFLVHELKPHIDNEYRTFLDAEHTFVMGASMGAIVSAYAVCEYPLVFGGAACMSTHWPIGGGVTIPYLHHALPDPRTHRFYFDHGTEDMEIQYSNFQKQADAAFREAGYRRGDNWISRVWIGHGHTEADWSARVDRPLHFLLGAKAH